MAQHVEMTLSFAIVAAGQQPVQIDLTPLVSATLTFQSEPPRPISLTVGQDGTYQANIQPQQPGRYVLAYRAAVDTPRGSVILGEDRVVFDVYPTKLVTAKVVSPSGDHFVATDMFLRPAGLPLEIQLVDKDGKELSPGEIGATNPMAVFDVKVVDAKKNDLSGKLKLVNTGKPGLFRAENNTLGPGRYEVSVIPATTLSKDYVWAEKSWSKVIYGDVNSLFFAVLGMALVVLAVGVTSAARYVQASKHPLSGYIEVFQQMPASDGTTFRKQFIKEQLPRRNRATITTAKGIAGLLQAIPFMPVKGAGPIGRIIVTCPTEEDSKAGRARVEVRFRDGKRQSALLDPGQAATPLPFGYYIEKGPRKVSSAGNLVEVPDTFYRPVRG